MTAIVPARGSGSIHSNAPVTVTFSTAMNEQSVEQHFSLQPVQDSFLSLPWIPKKPLGPRVRGTFHWSTPRTMVFDHPVLWAGTHYQIVLDGGFQDAQGGVNTLRHSWVFETDNAPQLTGSDPSSGSTGVGIDQYLDVSFGYRIQPSSLVKGSITLDPHTPVTLRRDPKDPYVVIVAPQHLLKPRTTYHLHVSREIRNTDGNGLARARTITFRTQKPAPVQGWITFVGGNQGTGDQGVWLVQASPDLPRPLASGAYTQASWAAGARQLLVQRSGDSWAVMGLDGSTRPLPFTAQWAAFVGTGPDIAYLQNGTLQVQRVGPPGKALPAPTTVATGVSAAAVEPTGNAIAYAVDTPSGWQVDGYDAGLAAAYQLAAPHQPVDDLAWSTDGTQLAFRVRTESGAGPTYRLEALTLGGGGTPVTVATGAVGNPAWESDDRTLLFTDALPGQHSERIFRAVVGESQGQPAAGSGLPAGKAVQIRSFALSPDGRQIAYLTDQDGKSVLWLMNADGTGVTQLTGQRGSSFPGSAAGLSWTPTAPTTS